MTDEYSQNLIKGIKWLPIYDKALEIQEEFEKRNTHDLFYHMGISDVLYYALVLFHDDIINHDGDVHDLIKGIREEFISTQEDNIRFMSGFGKIESEFEDRIVKSRQNNLKQNEWMENKQNGDE